MVDDFCPLYQISMHLKIKKAASYQTDDSALLTFGELLI
jgi:hypothetical protein